MEGVVVVEIMRLAKGVFRGARVNRRRAPGPPIADDHLVRCLALPHSHVISNGTAFFDRPSKGLGFCRQSGEAV